MVIYRRVAETDPSDPFGRLEDVAIPESRLHEAPPRALPRGLPQAVKRMTRSELDARYPSMKRL
jgi:hypothetical protein